MKETIAIFAALVMVITMAAALAEGTGAPALPGGVQFGMDVDQVIRTVDRRNYETDRERTRGTEFLELEYEDFSTTQGMPADVTYLFADNLLVAIRLEIEDRVDYEQVRAQFTKDYGEAVPFSAENLGNAVYAIDDDGNLRDCREMITTDSFTVVLEQDHDGEADVTILDLTAAYVKN